MPRDPLLLSELDTVTPAQAASLRNLSIRAEARRVRLTAQAPDPAHDNAWCYVRDRGASDHPGVLPTYLGPVINVARGQPLVISWKNALPSAPGHVPPILAMPPLDHPVHTHMMPGMNPSVGTATHLHGIRVDSGSDGWPLSPACFTPNPYGFPQARVCSYPNTQRAAMLWFHDHAMDNTAQQVYAGLAGVYFIRDGSDTALFTLIGSAAQELPLVIQDRILNARQDRFDYGAGLIDRPEFLGQRILVNGRPAPTTPLERRTYRLRLLNGSNARTYALTLADFGAATPRWYGHLLTVIGNDGGLYSRPKALGAGDFVLLAPGERLDVLLDLSRVPRAVSALRLVNLAVQQLLAGVTPEPIFQSPADSVALPSTLTAAQQVALASRPEADVMEFTLTGAPAVPLDQGRLAAILTGAASDDDFQWNGTCLEARAAPVQNRLILLMNNTAGLADCPHTGQPWNDVQLWELTAASGPGPRTLTLPFKVPLGPSAVAGSPAPAQEYLVSRFSFFRQPPDPVITENPAATTPPTYRYPRLFSSPATIRPRAGTYERWYVANLGNDVPLGSGALPDMHPFHMHLVNFVVTRRWSLQAGAAPTFVETTGGVPLDADREARHDTVRVLPNELLELLVYFPAGYMGRYPYHCHLVEHEDMGMMLHFEVRA